MSILFHAIPERSMKLTAIMPAATSVIVSLMISASSAQVAGGGAPGARGGRGSPAIERAKATDLEKPNTPTKPVDAAGFIQRWLILDPITAEGVTQNQVQAAVKTQHFPDELTLIPHDGM